MTPPLEAFVQTLGIKSGVDHSRCHSGTCRPYQICPTCGAETFVLSWHGRWDAARNGGKGATAIPFDPVAVGLACGHHVGDIEAAQPSSLPSQHPTP